MPIFLADRPQLAASMGKHAAHARLKRDKRAPIIPRDWLRRQFLSAAISGAKPRVIDNSSSGRASLRRLRVT